MFSDTAVPAPLFPQEISLVSGRFDLNKCIRTYAHSDVKLKGFGAAAAMRTGKEYRLFCGRGIKNIHIWSFKPEGPGEWSCLYDTNTNGSTVELVAFRNGGLEGISKVRTGGRGSAAGSVRHICKRMLEMSSGGST